MRSMPRVMPALITPFSRSGELDTQAHSDNVARMWELGMRGILIAGSTGEGPYLEPGERRRLVKAARDAAPRAFLLCGVHAETVRMARAAMQEATAGAADAVLLATPTTLVRHRPDLIEAFFLEVAEGAPLPLLLYSVPPVTAVELAEESVAVLGAHPGVIGMKDSGGDPLRAGRLADTTPVGFRLFAGATRAITLSVASGAYGAITASANYAPRLVRDTVLAARRSVRAATPVQSLLTNVSVAVERHGIPAVKYAARLTGLAAGSSRSPLEPPPSAARAAIRNAMRAAGLV